MHLNERRASLSSTCLSPLGLPGLHQREKRQSEGLCSLSQPGADPQHKDSGGRGLATGPLESSARGHAVKQEPRAEAMESGPGEPQSDSFLTKCGHSAQTDTPGQHEEGGIRKDNATIPDKTIVTDYHCRGFHLPTIRV